MGPDEIPGRLLHEGADWLAEPLTKLFNLSLSFGSVPVDWTRSNITPILKKGDKHLPSNYRPISLTSIVVKTLERLLHPKAYTIHQKFSPAQHGFRPGHSCQKLNFSNQSTSGQSRSIKAQEHMLSFLISLGLLILYHIRGFFSSLTIWVFEEPSLLQWFKAFLLNRQ